MHRVALAIGAFLMANAAMAEEQWPTITIDNIAQVSMPRQPQHDVVTREAGNEHEHLEHRYIVNEPKASWQLLTGVYPTGARNIDARVTMQGTLDGNIHQFDVKWETLRWHTYYDAPAVEAVGVSRSDGRRVLRLFTMLAGNRYFLLVYDGPSGTEKSPFVNLFFASFLPKSRNYWRPCTAGTACVD